MRLMIGLAATLVLGGCSSLTDLATVGRTGAGLVAKTVCSGVFVQGRTVSDVRAAEAGVDSRLRLIQTHVDQERGVVSAAFGNLFFHSRAGWNAETGCALGHAGGETPPSLTIVDRPEPWPVGDAVARDATRIVPDAAALADAVDPAFAAPAEGALDPATRSVLIVHQGQLVFQRHAPGWDSLMPQFGASMSKTLSGALVGILIGEGRLALTTAALRPEWTDGRAGITIEHLLHMESGLAFDEDYGGAADPGQMLYAVPGASDFVAAKPMREPAGTRFYYSSGDTNLLMAVAHARSGRGPAQWAAFPRQALFAPLGMRGAVLETDTGGDFVGSTFGYLSAGDWARFGLLLARDGVWNGDRILPPGWVDYMATPTALSETTSGGQIWLRGRGSPAPIMVLRGYGGQSVTIVPESDIVIVRTGWNVDPAAFDEDAFADRILAALDLSPRAPA